MAKNILQDIVPPEKKSIRNIPIPPRPGRLRKSVQPNPESMEQHETEIMLDSGMNGGTNDNPLEVYKPKGGGHSRKGVWIGIIGAIIVIVFFVASIFSSATIKVTPKQIMADAGGREFTAAKDTTLGGISFDVVRVSKSDGVEVVATGEEEVERKASGTIIIYNDYDENNQRLIRNTRFETPEGLIYRINESVIVPGQQTVDGKKIPGSIEVVVYADEPGEEYNVSLKDFTIPGFEGDPRFDKMYARSKTEMTGGIVGKVKTISESDKAQAETVLQGKLQNDLVKEIESQVPENFLIISDGTTYTWRELPQSNPNGDKVTFNEEGTVYAIILNQDSFASYLAGEIATDLPQNSVRILNPESLNIRLTDKDTFNPEDTQRFTFTIDSQVGLVATVDENDIKEDLVGKQRKDLNSILANYAAIKEAKAIVRPFWKRSFPEKPKNIKVEEVITIGK